VPFSFGEFPDEAAALKKTAQAFDAKR